MLNFKNLRMAILVAVGLFAAGSYVDAAHTANRSHGAKAVEISTQAATAHMGITASDDWDSPALY